MGVPVSSAGEQHSRECVIDVLVPTRNRPTELATTLAGLAAQDHPFDVLVSDQSDGPASFETPPATALLRVLAGHGRRIRTTRHLPRRGLAEHRAAMLAASSAPFALFCDDDVWLEPGVVGRLHEAIVELRCGLVGAAVQGLSYLHDFWPDLPAAHCGEDVLVQHRVLARAGGAGILPSGAVHLESPTTVPDRTVQARTVIRLDPAAR
jgi:glycosyltransferase involved in cell wall biosynthesis